MFSNNNARAEDVAKSTCRLQNQKTVVSGYIFSSVRP